jgi:hypothetical protein
MNGTLQKAGRRLAKQLVILLALAFSALPAAPALAAYAAPTNWQWANPLPQGNDLNAVAYGNGLFVAVGDKDTILTSSDGTHWTVRRGVNVSPNSGNLYGVTYGGGQFVVVGGTGPSGYAEVYTSPDGVTWTSQSSGAPYDLYAVTYGGGLFVAVGNGVATSPDGVIWTPRSGPGGNAVTYDSTSGYFVAVGSAVGNAFNTAYSTDGIHWTSQTFSGTGNFYGVAAGNVAGAVYYVGVGYNLTTAGQVWLSTGPSLGSNTCGTPTQATLLTGNNSVNAAVYDPTSGHFLAVGHSGLIINSGAVGDLCTGWTVQQSASASYNLKGIAAGNGTLVAVGTAGTILIVPADGSATTQINTSVTPYTLHGVTYGDSRFVAVGVAGSVYTSPDGVTWTSQNSGTSDGLNGVVYDAVYGEFAAVGIEWILTSPDGVTWTTQASGSGMLAYLRGVTVGAGGQLVAVGNALTLGAPGVIYYSNNGGSTWNSDTVPAGTGTLTGVAYGGGTYVAVDISNNTSGSILYSSDGVNWTTATSFSDCNLASLPILTSVAYGDGQFVAGDANGDVWVSSDGKSWTARTPYMRGSGYLNAMAYGNGGFLAAGIDSQIIAAPGASAGHLLSGSLTCQGDGWTQPVYVTVESSSSPATFFGAAYGNGRFVVVGDPGTILTSAVPPGSVTVVANPTSITADGTSTAALTATVLDADGNPLSGVTVGFTTSLGTLTTPSAVTNALGVATDTLTSSATPGTATVTATSGGVQGTTSVTFTTTSTGGGGGAITPAPSTAPVVTLVSPDSGLPAGGTQVSITGTGFTGAKVVDFGPNPAASFTLVSDTQITAVAPPGNGTVDVTVTTAGGTSALSSADRYTYVAPTPSCVSPFSDVPSGYWAAQVICQLAAQGIVAGFPDGTFRPHDPVTRAQFATMLVKADGLAPLASGATPFADVPSTAWYAPYVAAAYKAGMVAGTGPTTFDPNASITREEIAVMLSKLLSGGPSASLGRFSDASSIDGWARPGVEAAVGSGLMAGFPDGTFRPLGITSRAQAAAVLVAYLNMTPAHSPS